MTMAEFFYSKPDYEKRVQTFLSKTPEPDISLDFHVESNDYIHAGKASSEIKLSLKKLGVDPETLRRVAIACYEGEINVTAHSLGGIIVANIYEDLIYITFDDNGPGIESIEKAMLPGFSTANDLAREMGFGAGLGLPNIKKNCDAMCVVSEKGSKTHLSIINYF